MEQEKLEELIKTILSDPRMMELIKNSTGEFYRFDEKGGKPTMLILTETKAAMESVPPEWKSNVYCQELSEGGSGCLNSEQAAKGDWNVIKVCKPSLNLIAKLATGIADEPLLKLLQGKLAAGTCRIELAELCSVEGIKHEPYRRLFEGHLKTIRSFGIKVETMDAPSREPSSLPEVWVYKALTERDLLDIEKGTVLTIGRKCIVTSLAADMARRKSIRICREGEER